MLFLRPRPLQIKFRRKNEKTDFLNLPVEKISMFK
jgi:hypothetical protein